jgi:two-component system sensor histidine kinase KdpD
MKKTLRSIEKALKSPRIASVAMNLLVTLGIMALSTIVAVLFKRLDMSESDSIMLYILGVLFSAQQTKGYYGGIFAAVLGVLSFNFFFTAPLYTLNVNNSEYLVTFGVMLIVALITSTLTTRFKREAQLSLTREKRTEILYKISRNLLTAHSVDQIVSTSAVNIATLCGSSTVFYPADEKELLSEPYIYSLDEDEGAGRLLGEIRKKEAGGALSGEVGASGDVYYMPVAGRSRILGVIGVNNYQNKLTDEQKILIGAVGIQVALSLEREFLSRRQQQSELDVESERMRSDLLRSISHDLRTPLTGIVGSASTLISSWASIDDDAKKSLLSGVLEESQWLSRTVNNILDITRIEDGRFAVKRNLEAIEEIIGDAVSIVKKYAGNRKLSVNIPDSLTMVSVDAGMIKQMLINLLDNAIKYTADTGNIEISFHTEDDAAVFEVRDDGAGIDEKNLPHIFDRFYTTDRKQSGGRKGIGLGLAICKSIVLAHGGTITAANLKGGGALFRITL